jgi:hypothetical protein
MLLPLANTRREEARTGTNKIQPSAIERITHDIVNQLSVITLCCCELRAHLRKGSNRINY